MNRRRRKAAGAGGGNRFGGCVGYGFFGIFALAGLGILIGLFVLPLLKIIDARGWDETRCTITSSRVASHSSSDGTTYSIDVRYTYQVNGVDYTGDRYNWGSGSSSGYDGKQEVVDSLPVGSTVVCWVDPDDPQESIIQRGAGWFLLWGLFALPFVAVGFGGLLFLIKAPSIRRKAEKIAAESGGSSPHRGLSSSASSSSNASFTSGTTDASARDAGDAGDEGHSGGLSFRPPSSASGQGAPDATLSEHEPVWPDRPPAAPAGSLDLEPAMSRLGKVGCIGIFALIWNGFVGFALYQMLSENAGDWMRFEVLFLTPFVLVGLGLLLLLVHQFLATFNPVPRLQLDTAAPEVGTVCQIQWSLSGNYGRLRSLSLTLEGREAATYRRGTSTTTDHHTFYEQELTKMEPVRMARGACELVLPAPSVPSWEGLENSNNKISWRLKVQGDIPFWPDVDEAFPLTVAPPSYLGRRALPASPVRSTGDDPGVEGRVEIELDRGRYEPGETVEGTVRWRGADPSAESLLVSLLWHTEGKGTEDSETVAQTSVGRPGSQGEHRFALALPTQPWSFSGTLISVVWLVEASLEPDGDLHRLELISAPGGDEVKI